MDELFDIVEDETLSFDDDKKEDDKTSNNIVKEEKAF